MSEIWKYRLDPNGPECVRGPPEQREPASLYCFEFPTRGSPRVLSAQVQGGHPNIWAEVDTTAPESVMKFEVYPTGTECDLSGLVFVGTCQVDGGIVLHVFQRGWT